MLPSVLVSARRRLLLGLLILPFACTVVRPANGEPPSIRSEKGRFAVRLTGIERPERLNHLHGFDLLLTDNAGKPVTGASIVLSGLRRDSNNPLPTSPRVSSAPGLGLYRAEGLRFHMAGEWQLIFAIDSGGIHDSAVLDVTVK